MGILALAACRPLDPIEPGSTPPAPERHSAGVVTATYRLTDADVSAVVHGVSVARQLPVSHPIGVTRLSQAQFVERLLHRRDDGKPAQGLTEESAFLVGFDFVPPPDRRHGIASIA